MTKKNVLTKAKKLKADQLAREHRFDEAQTLYENICQIDRSDVEAWIKLSAIHRRLGRFQEAESCGRQAVTLQPDLAQAHYILAAALHSQNRTEEALAGYRRAIKLKPDFTIVHYLLGNALLNTGLVEESLPYFHQAIALQPDHYEALCDLGAALLRLNLIEEAATPLQQASALRPGAPEALINLASLRERAGHIDEALTLYQRVLCTHPNAIDALARLAALLEKLGRLDEAKILVERGFPLTTTPSPTLTLVAARLARREGRIEEAVTLLKTLDGQSLPNSIKGEVLVLLGQFYDRLGDADSAYPQFVEGNRCLALATRSITADADRYLQRVRSARDYLVKDFAASMDEENHVRGEAPVFLVGFPRSGTTLLDQALDCHPALQTMEEQPAAAIMENAFLEWAGGRRDAVADLGSEQVSFLRKIYFDEVARSIQRKPGTVLVDKMPLNLVRVPLLWRVFPEARFILALRHPCDVCLSCFMQSFAVNEAMANFFTLEGAVRAYAEVMGFWMDLERTLPLHHHRVRYESMVTDFEGEMRALLDVLGVGWDDAVLGHTEHASQRSVINTPSYHQVTQPIYQHAKYRWKRYANQFESLMPGLRPYIKHFGYEE